MDSDQGKLFIGGISWDTTEDKLRDHFSNYGDVIHASVMREKNTGKPRGFGFVVFADPSILDRVLEEQHVIDGRTVRATTIKIEIPFCFCNIGIYVLAVEITVLNFSKLGP